jgi:hypothetical protein
VNRHAATVSNLREEDRTMRLYERLVRLYPADVRFAYGREMIDDLAATYAACRAHGSLRLTSFVARTTLLVLVDVTMEWLNNLYSHRSFHGRRQPDPGVVRPPNMGKQEWFDALRNPPSR